MIKTPDLVTKHYTLPFRTDQDGVFIWDFMNYACLQCTGYSYNHMPLINRLVKILNGEPVELPEDLKFTFEDGDILANRQSVIIIRGWGRLQQIKEDDPATVQDTFGQYVTDLLNESAKAQIPVEDLQVMSEKIDEPVEEHELVTL